MLFGAQNDYLEFGYSSASGRGSRNTPENVMTDDGFI